MPLFVSFGGWTWDFEVGLMIRTALGGTFTISSSTEASPSWTPRAATQTSLDALARATESYLDDTIQSFVHTATLTLAVGWRL